MTSPHAGPRRWWLAVAVAAVLVTVLTWPTVPRWRTVGRIDTGDGRYSIWNVGWIDHALLTSPRHLFDANIFYPHTGTLAYSELNLVAGALGLPVFAITHDAVAATNAAIVLGLGLAFVLMWALVRRLTQSDAAGLAAATAFAFCPYVQAHTAHIQLLMIFAVPIVWLALEIFRQRPTTRRAVVLGLAVVVSGLACAYYGIYAGVSLGALALLLGRPDWRYARGLALAVAVAVALTAVVLVPYARARSAVAAPTASDLDEVRAYSATLHSYLSSPAWVHEHIRDAIAARCHCSSALLQPGAESVFPGVLLLLLASFGVITVMARGSRADRRVVVAYGTVAVLACWASFGPDAGLYRVLMIAVPRISLLRAPVRFGIVVVGAMAVLAGFGVRRLTAGRPWLAGLLVALLAAETATLPWPVVEAGQVPDAYRWLASAPRGAVVEFPFPYRPSDFLNHSRAMFYSTYHWQPLVNGYSDVVPDDFARMAAPINAFPDPASFVLMRRLGVRYVIWHMAPRSYDAPSRDKIRARLSEYASYLRPVTTDEDTWLFEIVAWPDEARAGAAASR